VERGEREGGEGERGAESTHITHIHVARTFPLPHCPTRAPAPPPPPPPSRSAILQVDLEQLQPSFFEGFEAVYRQGAADIENGYGSNGGTGARLAPDGVAR